MPDPSMAIEYSSAREDFFEKMKHLFEEFDSIEANENVSEPVNMKLKRIHMWDLINVYLLKNLHVIDNPLFTEVESRIRFYDTVLKKMEEFLHDHLLNKPYDFFENENERDTIMDFKARCLLVRFEFLKLKEKVTSF